MKFSFTIGFFNLTVIIGLRMQTVKKQDWTELSLQNNVYNAKVSFTTRLGNGFGIEYTYFHWF